MKTRFIYKKDGYLIARDFDRRLIVFADWIMGTLGYKRYLSPKEFFDESK